MKRNLDDLIRGLEKIEISRTENLVINGVTNDSRQVKKGYVFVAIRGDRSDGHNYILSAIDNGAKVVVVDRDFNEHFGDDICIVKCQNTHLAYSCICANWFKRPSEKLKIVGVTGTNGKTSVTTLLYNLFKGLGYKVGLISTVEVLIDSDRYETSMTTPDAFVLHDYFVQMYERGCSYVFMEVSSHALDQHRVSHVDFDVAVFTNITHDHLDYHGSFKDYIGAKKKLFDMMGEDAVAIVNADEANGAVMLQNCIAYHKTYGVRSMTDYKAKILSSESNGMLLEFNGIQFYTRLVGRFNVYNLLSVYGVSMEILDLDEVEVIEALSSLVTVKGRMEVVHAKPYVIVDYAHTPDALNNVLKTIKETYSGEVIVVVGCGGDRDQAKRPIMGKIAALYGDHVILTSDNPRSELPDGIIDDMLSGIDASRQHKVLRIVDRAMAIKTALKISEKKDVVIIAGKGHEEYQEIRGEKKYFSDQKTVKDILSKDI